MDSFQKCICFLVLVLAGCETPSFSGDGAFTDRGASAATNRYELDLGLVDLSQESSYLFRFRGLPQERFVVGVELSSPSFVDENTVRGKLAHAKLGISLTNPDGVVFRSEKRLDQLIWAHSRQSTKVFVYGRDDDSTLFSSEPNQSYTLSLKVVEPESSRGTYTSRIVAYAGGWK